MYTNSRTVHTSLSTDRLTLQSVTGRDRDLFVGMEFKLYSIFREEKVQNE